MARDDNLWGASFAIILITILIVGVIIIEREGIIPSQRASLIISGAGALATVLLALATFVSVRQNQRTVRELRKDREKPIVVDILKTFIHPAILTLDSDLPRLRSGAVGYSPNRRDLNLGRPVDRRSVDASMWSRFENEYPELLEKFGNWWDIRNELETSTEILADEIQPLIEEWYNDDRMDSLLANAVNGDSIGHEIEPPIEEFHREVWETAPNIFHEQSRNHWKLLRHGEGLLDELVEIEDNLKEEYGISQEEIE